MQFRNTWRVLINFRMRIPAYSDRALKGLLILISLVPMSLFAQLPAGAWRDHLPYNKGNMLTETNEKIFCATTDGSLFSWSKKDQSLQKYSKINLLSDADVTTIASSSQQNVVMIGYSNGNLDMIIHDSIFNIPDIKRKLIVGDKAVNGIFFLEGYAYLACGFGIVVCDLDRREIKDTYLFGEGGTQVFVYSIAHDGQYLYAATTNGIYKALASHPNLADYHAWSKLTALPETDHEYRHLGWFNDKLFSLYRQEGMETDDIIAIDDDNWEIWTHSAPDRYSWLGVHDGNLIVCGLLSTRVYSGSEQLVTDRITYYANHALYDPQGVLWYASPFTGLVRIDEAGGGQVLTPDGPAYRDVGDMEIHSGQLWAGGGTEASKWAGYGAYAFIEERWENHNSGTEPELEGFLNISEIAIDPSDPDHVIGGSYGYGLAEFRNGTLIDIIDETDGMLMPVPGYGHGYVLVRGVDIERDGSVWVATTLSDQPVYLRDATGEWAKMDFDYGSFGGNTRISDLMMSSGGTGWLLIERSGLLVFEEENGEIHREKFFTVQNQSGQLLDRVFCIAEDKEGDVWVGTNNGPVIFSSNTDPFGQEVTGHQPEIPRNDGTPYIDYLLSTEKINAIEVDGANRKWIATEKSGVFLVSPDGKTEIHHFNSENSPLLSDNVQAIAVNDETGEVFFGTDKGIVSFRGDATEGRNDFSDVFVFPNPVREHYAGDITISGLVADVTVKITDISGNLVFETRSLGGQATWDGRNFRGDRVQTGVYLVFCTTDDGNQTHVTKLLFLH